MNTLTFREGAASVVATHTRLLALCRRRSDTLAVDVTTPSLVLAEVKLAPLIWDDNGLGSPCRLYDASSEKCQSEKRT